MKKYSAMLMLAAFLPVACSVPAPTTPSREKEDKATAKMLSIPDKLEKRKWPAGTIVSIEKGKIVPFAGILLKEERAQAIAKLRLAYDRLYRDADANRRFSVKAINLYKHRLTQADAEILRLRTAQSSWWNRNKVAVSIAVTFMLTLGLGGLAIWGASELKQ